MPDETEPRPQVVQDILNMLYASFLQDFALRCVLVSKGLLTHSEVDTQYKALSDTPELQRFRERMGIVDSELTAVLSRLLGSFEGPIQ